MLSHSRKFNIQQICLHIGVCLFSRNRLPAAGKQATGTDELPQPLEPRVRNWGTRKKKKNPHKKVLEFWQDESITWKSFIRPFAIDHRRERNLWKLHPTQCVVRDLLCENSLEFSVSLHTESKLTKEKKHTHTHTHMYLDSTQQSLLNLKSFLFSFFFSLPHVSLQKTLVDFYHPGQKSCDSPAPKTQQTHQSMTVPKRWEGMKQPSVFRLDLKRLSKSWIKRVCFL